ncbi:MAG TPA: S9 family peptidase [Bryobacteraceae bacterium]
MQRSHLIACCLLTCLIVSAQSPKPKRLVSLDDMHKFHQVGDPQCSPDGKWIAYTVSTVDVTADKRDTDIWMVSWDGKDDIRVTSSPDSENAPKWSPDGKYLSFLSSRAGKAKGNQVWILDRRGGEAQQLTDVKGRISGYDWSPDSKRLVLTMTEVEEDAKGKDGKEAEQKPKPIVIDRYHFKQDGQGYLNSQFRARIYFFDIATKKLEALGKEVFDESAAVFSPDGKWIAFVSKRGADPDRSNNSDVFVAESKPGAEIRKLTTNPGPDQGPLAWSPDSKTIAYLQGSPDPKVSVAYDMFKLATVPVEGGASRVITGSLDRGVTSPKFSDDGKSIDVLVADDRSVYPARVSVEGGPIERLLGGKISVSPISRHGACFAALVNTDTESGEVYAIEGGSMRKLTSHNDALLSELEIGETEEVAFKAKDGNEAHGLLTKPPKFQAGVKYPMLLLIHGGPNGQDDHRFSFDRQFYAANGYLVLNVNYRGSAGRGQAYTSAISGDWGNKEVADLLAGVDYIVSTGMADPDRLAVGGWSYGGILTDYMIASTTRFKAAVAGAGTAFTVSYYGTDQYILQYDNEIGPPWKNFDRYIKMSYPLLHADRIKTPTMFQGGDRDFNVPISGGEQMYQALRSLGVDTKLIVYPGEPHGISRPSFQRDRLQRDLDWYNKYVMPPAKGTATPTSN